MTQNDLNARFRNRCSNSKNLQTSNQTCDFLSGEFINSVQDLTTNFLSKVMDRDTKRERLHSTVRLNQFTLQFEDSGLEKAYQAEQHPRKKALWLRSLLPAAAFQIIFALADGLDYPVEHLLVTIPTRVLLAVC